MVGHIRALLTLLALAVGDMVAPSAALAQCRLCSTPTTAPGSANASDKPIRLEVVSTIDFDRLILTGPGHGSALLRPDGSTMATGAVAPLGARSVAGQISIRGEPGRAIRVDLPRTIEMYGLKGGTIRIESIQSDLPEFPELDATGLLKIRIGGELRVSGEVDGDFRGDVPVIVDYL
jgi:hypothetical protein